MSTPFPRVVWRRLGLLTPRNFQYDSVTRLRPWGNSYLVVHPDDVRHVLVSQHDAHIKEERLAGTEGFDREGNGVLTSSGARHQQLRATLRPALGEQSERIFHQQSQRCAEALVRQWAGCSEVCLNEELPELSLKVLLGALLGPQAGADPELRRMVLIRQHATEARFFSRLPWRRWLPRLLGMPAAQRAISTRIYREMERPPGQDILSQLKACADSRQACHDEALTLTSTGHETLGQSLVWTLILLSQRPQLQARIRQRLMLGDDTLLQASWREALRLYPPSWLFSRRCLSAQRLPSGFAVPPGSNLLLCPYLSHRSPEVFPDPEAFVPDRFLQADWRARFRYAFFPFGAGPHVCLGERLARIQSLLVLSQILQRFSLALQGEQPIGVRLGITLRPSRPVVAQLTAAS